MEQTEQHFVASKESQQQRTARQRRAAADRARRYRLRKKSDGAPLPRDVDAAMVESLSYWIARSGVTVALMPVDVMRTARLILERDGFSPDAAKGAITDRLKSRPEHLWPDAFPSLRPGPIERLRETRTGPWTTDLAAIERHLTS